MGKAEILQKWFARGEEELGVAVLKAIKVSKEKEQ